MKTPSPRLCVLTVDGGGIRGLIPLVFLTKLETLLQDLTNQKNARVSDFVDIVAGTSTGAIIATLLLHPRRASAEQILQTYLRDCRSVFKTSWWRRVCSMNGLLWNLYRSRPLEEVLEESLGGLSFSELTKPCFIPTFDVTQGTPYVFSSIKATKDHRNDYLMKDVLRAAIAAPTYFSSMRVEALAGGRQHTLVDGGVYVNNPTALGITETLAAHSDAQLGDLTVLSLGTGSTKYSIDFRRSAHWGALMWASRMIDVQFETSSASIHRHIEILLQRAEGATYLRLNPSLHNAGIPALLDDCSQQYIDKLMDLAYIELEEREVELNALVRRMVE